MKGLRFLAIFLALVILLCSCKSSTNVVIINDTSLNLSENIDIGNSETKTTPPEEPPKDEIMPAKTVYEGELVSFPNLKAVDPDGDPVTYKFSAPLDENGKWQTKKGDAGTHTTTITASDGKMETSINVLVIVKRKNTPPVMKKINNMEVYEGEAVSFNPAVTDADGDDIVTTYSGWMTSSSYKTTYNDAGTYTVTITASDGTESVSQDVNVSVKNVNRAPVLNDIPDVTVNEGELVKVLYLATDLDGDKVTYTFSEPLNSKGEWQTKVGNAGSYTTTIRASDGELEDKRTINIIVKSLNKAPVLELIGDKIANADKELTFTLTATDADNDVLTYSVAGLPEGATFDEKTATFSWTPKESDGGIEHKVTFVVNDGKLTDSETITITVNRAPKFQWG